MVPMPDAQVADGQMPHSTMEARPAEAAVAAVAAVALVTKLEPVDNKYIYL